MAHFQSGAEMPVMGDWHQEQGMSGGDARLEAWCLLSNEQGRYLTVKRQLVHAGCKLSVRKQGPQLGMCLWHSGERPRQRHRFQWM